VRRFLGLVLLLSLLPGSASGLTDRGSAVVLDAASGAEIGHVAANGAVVAAVADGHDGWFVGGSFTRIGGRHRVAFAHLLPSGAVDPGWQASIGSASGRPVAVYALARTGSRLFVAGPFGRVGGLQRPGLAALDTRTGGVLRRWAPQPRAWLDVQALTVAGRRLLVARNWNYPVPGITALDTRTAKIDRRWNPHLRLIGDAGSFSTLLPFRSRVYVTGSFRVAGLDRSGLVALDARTGAPDRRWAPSVPNCSVCNGFAVLYGLAVSMQRVYISGAFSSIDGEPRNGVAAFDPQTGALDRGWKPARGSRDVFRLVLSGSRLYLGGSAGLWALDARTGATLRLPRNHAPRQVLALAPAGNRVLVAGRT
jgi:outer membrane protein assembly factor BamB